MAPRVASVRWVAYRRGKRRSVNRSARQCCRCHSRRHCCDWLSPRSRRPRRWLIRRRRRLSWRVIVQEGGRAVRHSGAPDVGGSGNGDRRRRCLSGQPEGKSRRQASLPQSLSPDRVTERARHPARHCQPDRLAAWHKGMLEHGMTLRPTENDRRSATRNVARALPQLSRIRRQLKAQRRVAVIRSRDCFSLHAFGETPSHEFNRFLALGREFRHWTADGRRGAPAPGADDQRPRQPCRVSDGRAAARGNVRRTGGLCGSPLSERGSRLARAACRRRG